MVILNKNHIEKRILYILLKDIFVKHTVTSISNKLKISRVGSWKALKKLEDQNFIILSKIGSGKTNAFTIELNWENPLVEKNLSTILTEQALDNKRWINDFSDLEKYVDFLVIYGSILDENNDAKDIDLLGVVSKKNYFVEIDKIIQKIQKTQIKKIHIINFTPLEFRNELINMNKAFIDCIKKGIVLFGCEKFIDFIRRLQNEHQ